jgi:uncharacterized protein (DUF2141 family)
MNRKTSILTIFGIVLFVINCVAQGVSTLAITATNFENEKGQAVVNLFREQDDVPRKPFKTIKASIKDGVGKLVVDNLPNGSYAVIVYHDENDNNTLDHRLGFPNEPMGFSNGWNLSLFSGMPTFRKLRFEHNGTHTLIEVKVN